jgi:hypothetical protein
MQTHSLSPILTLSIIGAFAWCASDNALAIEPQPDNANPPAELDIRIENIQEAEAKIPFIGVVTVSLPEMVADHLKLKHGTGIIVRTVLPDSPADLSGIKVNDIILSINDAAINDPETFSTKIRDFKVGDKLKLKAIQKGTPSEIEVTLGERPIDQLAGPQKLEPLLDGIPDADAERLRDLIERNLGALGQNGFREMPIPDALADGKLQEIQERMRRALEQAPDGDKNFQFKAQSTVRMMDGDGSIEIKSNGDDKEVTVRDQKNEIVWSGPWDTEQDKAAAPDNIRERIEKVNGQGGGFQLRFQQKK